MYEPSPAPIPGIATLAGSNLTERMRVSNKKHLLWGARGDTRTAIVWLLRDTRRPNAPLLSGARVEMVTDLEDGVYTAEFHDTRQGRSLHSEFIFVDKGIVFLEVPEFDNPVSDVTVLIQAM
jgi:hypothetical protein